MTNETAGRRRAQAALFDGIMFLLIASMSAGIMYSFMASYGESQDRVMRSSHVLNYMQSTMKSIYSIDSSTLKDVPPVTMNGLTVADCSILSNWQGTITVADLLKKDLSDPVEAGAGARASGKLDNKYGTAEAGGKTALWCLLNEVMKPFTQAGYRYIAEVLNANLEQTYPSMAQTVITNSLFVQNNPAIFPKGQLLCEAASESFKELLTVSSPFRILVEDNGPQTITYTIRVCVWPSNETNFD